jgi:hypothetical protein
MFPLYYYGEVIIYIHLNIFTSKCIGNIVSFKFLIKVIACELDGRGLRQNFSFSHRL